MLPLSSFPQISFFVDDLFLSDLEKLPWPHAVAGWRSLGVKHFNIKHGLGRHPVVFVQAGNRKYVIKELGFEVARREVENYKQMLLRGLHTLIPAGCVAREEEPLAVWTPVGRQYQRNLIDHTVTLLIDHVLPDSQLYRRAFNLENRKRIWDAIVDLFVELHANGVYWGDASLANTLIKFMKIDVPLIGRKTRLKAFLADAETVEIHDSVPDSMREADLAFFLESMEWVNEDLRASDITRDEMATAQDKDYLRENYERRYEVELKGRAFEKLSGLEIAKYLGPVREPAYFEVLRQHIEEHKWYASERLQREVSYAEGARDWLERVFIPMCELFRSEGLLDLFPGKTASDLYVEIMNNKYVLSRKAGRDVGMIRAARDYANRFGEPHPVAAFWRSLAGGMLKILGQRKKGIRAPGRD